MRHRKQSRKLLETSLSQSRVGTTNSSALWHLPLHLLLVLFFPCLCLHLLNLNGVRLTPTHVQLMIPHAQGQDPLINPKTGSIEHKVLEGKKAAEFFRADKMAHICPWAHNACTHTPETAYQISKSLNFGGSDLLASVKLNPKVLDRLCNPIVYTPVGILYQNKERVFPRVSCQGSGRLKTRTHVCYLWHKTTIFLQLC